MINDIIAMIAIAVAVFLAGPMLSLGLLMLWIKQEKKEMTKNNIICSNTTCPNNTNKGCDRSFVTMDAAGRCLSANQQAAGHADNDTAKSALAPATRKEQS